MEEAFVALLLADAGLAALVGDRIFWSNRPQGSPLPAIVLHRITSGRSSTLKGRVALSGPLVQADCFGRSYAEAKAIGRALIVCLDVLPQAPFQGAFVENERDTFEPAQGPQASGETDIHLNSLDVRVWHTSA